MGQPIGFSRYMSICDEELFQYRKQQEAKRKK
jgi:hypothetical protein